MIEEKFKTWIKQNPGRRPSPFSHDVQQKILGEWYQKNTGYAEKLAQEVEE